MKVDIKQSLSYQQAGLIVLVIVLLTVFCQMVGLSLLIPLILLFLGMHLFVTQKAGLTLFLQLGLLLCLILTPILFAEYTGIRVSPLFIPIASISMLTALLFNRMTLTFIMAFVSSLIAGLVYQPHGAAIGLDLTDIQLMMIYFTGGLTAAYTVREARTRGTLISSGIAVGVIQVVCLLLIEADSRDIFTSEFFFNDIRPLIINGFVTSFVVMATLKIFEAWFGVLTNFSLLELNDSKQPLLNRMSLEAPGTYHHSQIVSTMSEAAADGIGANALLTRVGAWYHDIGKMIKPEYFTENQLFGFNRHDHMEPSMSRLVILNHVKEGVELARKNKLNPLIIDFISQHHGTSLMYYFYQKALEEADDQNSVKESQFRYPGPKPQSRETAIVLLADSSEAATRTLDEPNPQKIEEVVRKVINNKFIDGQLDECNLTLKEIDQIAVHFTRVLSAMYHGRVKYPEKKNGENRNRKQPEDNSHLSSSDQKDHS